MHTIEKIHNKIYKLLCSGEHYYHMLLMDYQTKYSKSVDYDKEIKKKYIHQAAVCRKFAEDFRQIQLPKNNDEISAYVDRVNNHLANMPALRLVIAQDDPELDIQKYLENLIFISEKLNTNAQNPRK